MDLFFANTAANGVSVLIHANNRVTVILVALSFGAEALKHESVRIETIDFLLCLKKIIYELIHLQFHYT